MFCEACLRDLRTAPASQSPHGKAWTTAVIVLVIVAVGVVWFFWMR
jgi:hypothetical protein